MLVAWLSSAAFLCKTTSPKLFTDNFYFRIPPSLNGLLSSIVFVQ